MVKAALESPTLILIGEVVALSPGWRRCRAAGVSLEGPPEQAGLWADGSWEAEAQQWGAAGEGRLVR